ncbi:MAG: hypothetical protein H7232_02095 [Aeromicrobium sp.]|nr:hypothetical protein [Burkholderiales bacterium]
MLLSPKYQFKEFASRTKNFYGGRGKNIEKVDTALKRYWDHVQSANVMNQASSLLFVMQHCNIWMEVKKDVPSNRDDRFISRWREISDLGKEAEVTLRGLIANNLFAPVDHDSSVKSTTFNRQLDYEAKRLNHVGNRKVQVVKPLDPRYQFERTMHLESGKKNPLSMSEVNESYKMFVAAADEDQRKKMGKFGKEEFYSKGITELRPADTKKLEAFLESNGNRIEVLYLKRDLRLPYIAVIQNGLLFRHNGFDKWDTGRAVIYAMDEYGNLFIEGDNMKPKDMGFQHSSFLAGRPVLCAGSIKIEDGRLVSIDNSSGHYRPTQKNLYQALLELSNQKVTLDNVVCDVSDGPNGTGFYTSAEEVLANKGAMTSKHPSYYADGIEKKKRISAVAQHQNKRVDGPVPASRAE